MHWLINVSYLSWTNRSLSIDWSNVSYRKNFWWNSAISFRPGFENLIKISYVNNLFSLTLGVSCNFDPDKAQHFVLPNLVPNCLQSLSADDKNCHLQGNKTRGPNRPWITHLNPCQEERMFTTKYKSHDSPTRNFILGITQIITKVYQVKLYLTAQFQCPFYPTQKVRGEHKVKHFNCIMWYET